MTAAFLALIGVVWAEEIAETQLPAPRASESATRRQTRGVRSDDRLSAALGAAKTAWPGMIDGNKRDAETYNAALAEVVAALQERRFADREIAGSFHLTLGARTRAGSTPPRRTS